MDHVYSKLVSKEAPIAVVGLGYVGLPLACLLADRFNVIGFDIDELRIRELREGFDRTKEVESRSRIVRPELCFTNDPRALADARVVIVAVPTPVDEFNVPDLAPVTSASRTVGRYMQAGTIVVFESTVYPGLTETVCAENLAAESGLELNRGFFLGYSPERVVPGDKLRTIDKIKKIVSGSTPEVASMLERVYGAVIEAGIHRAPTIAVAEAAKVIENTQRDLNIALVNELSMLFERLGIDTLDVLEAAGTKWNFLPFRPGLVGGHCIGVDPYYLTYLAEKIGFQTQVISAGRRINNTMGAHVATKTVSLIHRAALPPTGRLNVAIMGFTFKENVPDIRNSKVADLVSALKTFGVNVHVFDPVAEPGEVEIEYGLRLSTWDEIPVCDALVLAVTHDVFRTEYPLQRLLTKLSPNRIILDLKGMLSREDAANSGASLWRL